ncbi:MAG: iron complex transport system substrate-binding protein [Alphaproteobacteria bacterium]|jgi:iron complex transport system substrate-binding protein
MMAGAAIRMLWLARVATCLLVASGLFLTMPEGATAADKPQRIVSLNLCTDLLAIKLADRSRIKSVSFLAAEPASSPLTKEARGLTLNHGLAEEILPLKPDIVLAGTYGARYTVGLLRRLGHRVVELPLASKISDVPKHIRLIAKVLGEQARGEVLIARFKTRLEAVAKPPPGQRPLAVLFGANGITSGANNLQNAAITAAGFDNLAEQRGIQGVGWVTLETVAHSRPDALILGRLGVEYVSLATETLSHPALARSVPKGAVIALPHHLWTCATDTLAEAIERLATFRAGLSLQKGHK